ncbi:MAG TPA: glycosyltransferase family 87 protein [Blastocatellia bacterium]|nr:glycosyltransferase family 87 protein [Blastocatellia bacterium]
MSSRDADRPGLAKRIISLVRSNTLFLIILVIGLVNCPLYWIGRKPWELGSHINLIYWLYTPAVILYLITGLLIWRNPNLGKSALFVILLLGFAYRIPLVTAGPFFSSDINRYVWDGRVQAAGINPYIYIPADRRLELLRDKEVYPNINRKEYAPTLYPPGAQVIFLATYLLGGMSVIAMKFSMLFFEGITTLFLILIFRKLKQPETRIVFYLWNPLVIWEFAQSGHIDAAMIAMLAIAVWAYLWDKKIITGIFFALAALIKLYPAILFPAFYKKWDWKMPVASAATVLIFFAPYLRAGRALLNWTDHYFTEENYVSGDRYYLFGKIHAIAPWIPLNAYVVVAALSMLAVAAFMILKSNSEGDVVGNVIAIITLWILIDSPHFPWYFTWLAFAVALRPRPSYLILVCLAMIDYMTWLEEARPGITNFVTDLKFIVFYAVFTIETLWSSRLGEDLRQWLQVKLGQEPLISET